MDQKLLGIRIDYVRIDQAIEIVGNWLEKKGKHFIVTPNPEMLVDAEFDRAFKAVLNQADLSIPDSSRLGWGSYVKYRKSFYMRLLSFPYFLFPQGLPRFSKPTIHGIDLMEGLLSLSEEKGFTTAFLGGTPRVADKLDKCLRIKYPKLKIIFCSGNMQVSQDGNIEFDSQKYKMTGSKKIMQINENKVTNVTKVTKDRNSFNYHLLAEKIDIMFVAFGHGKQEKWIYKNQPKLNTRVMMGVGGSFDYLSGEVPRAPKIMRQMGLEWVFRIIVQPYRISRFWKLIYFIYKVMKEK